MALSTYAGSFQMTADSTADIAVTGVGFTPKLLIFWTGAHQTDAPVNVDGGQIGIGFSDGTNERAVGNTSGIGDIDGVTAAFVRRRMSANAVIMSLGGGSVAFRLNVKSMDMDGFTMEFPADTPGQAGDNEPENDDYIYFLALGGDDLAEWEIGSFDSNAAAGTQEVEFDTMTGTPDFLMLVGCDSAAGTDEEVITEEITEFHEIGDGLHDGVLSIGVATKLNQLVAGYREQSIVTVSNTFNTMREDAVAVLVDGDSTLLQHGNLEAMLAGGFRLRWVRAAARRMFYLALRGPSCKVGIGVTPGVPTKQPIPGVGLTPKAVLGLCGSLTPSVPSNITGVGFSFGGGTEAYQRCVSVNAPSSRVPDEPRRYVEDALIRIHSTSGQPRALGRIYEFGNNDLTLDWLISDPPSIRHGFVVFGDTDPTATSAQVFDNVARLDQIGHELDDPLFVTGVLWSGATAPGHRVVIGESDTLGDSANEIMRLATNPASATVFVPLNAQFLKGMQITQIDSGTLFVYLQTFSQTPDYEAFTSSGDKTLIAAQGADLSIYVTGIYMSPQGSSANIGNFKEGVGGTIRYKLRAEIPQFIPIEPAWKLPVNTALVMTLDNGNNTSVTIHYFVAAG